VKAASSTAWCKGDALLDEPTVDVGRREHAERRVVMLVVVPGEEVTTVRASSIDPKRSGKSGRYFIVLKCASLYALSSETCGREWVWGTPRSASKNATGFDFIEEPRSACTGPGSLDTGLSYAASGSPYC
jgi:hypothetical protein